MKMHKRLAMLLAVSMVTGSVPVLANSDMGKELNIGNEYSNVLLGDSVTVDADKYVNLSKGNKEFTDIIKAIKSLTSSQYSESMDLRERVKKYDGTLTEKYILARLWLSKSSSIPNNYLKYKQYEIKPKGSRVNMVLKVNGVEITTDYAPYYSSAGSNSIVPALTTDEEVVIATHCGYFAFINAKTGKTRLISQYISGGNTNYSNWSASQATGELVNGKYIATLSRGDGTYVYTETWSWDANNRFAPSKVSTSYDMGIKQFGITITHDGHNIPLYGSTSYSTYHQQGGFATSSDKAYYNNAISNYTLSNYFAQNIALNSAKKTNQGNLLVFKSYLDNASSSESNSDFYKNIKAQVDEASKSGLLKKVSYGTKATLYDLSFSEEDEDLLDYLSAKVTKKASPVLSYSTDFTTESLRYITNYSNTPAFSDTKLGTIVNMLAKIEPEYHKQIVDLLAEKVVETLKVNVLSEASLTSFFGDITTSNLFKTRTVKLGEFTEYLGTVLDEEEMATYNGLKEGYLLAKYNKACKTDFEKILLDADTAVIGVAKDPYPTLVAKNDAKSKLNALADILKYVPVSSEDNATYNSEYLRLANLSFENGIITETPDSEKPVIHSVTKSTELKTDYLTLTVDATDNIAVKMYSADNGIKWQTSNVFNITKNGTYQILAKDASGNISDMHEVVVENISEIVGVKITNGNLTVPVDEKLQLTAKSILKDKGSMQWISLNSRVATVDNNGLVTPKALGDCEIKVTIDSGLGVTYTDTATIKVIKGYVVETSFDIEESEIELNEKQTYKLNYVVGEEDATDKTVTWTSSDDTVATVTNGIVVAKKEGIAIITGKTKTGITDTVTVKVRGKAISNIEIENIKDVKTVYKKTETFKAKGNLVVNYNDGSKEIIRIVPSMVTNFDTYEVGESFIQLTYGGKTVEYDITVEDIELSPVTVNVDVLNKVGRTIKVHVSTTGDVSYVLLPNGAKVYKKDFDFTLKENGTHVFTVNSKDGVSVDSAIVEVDGIDNEAPVIAFAINPLDLSDVTVTVTDDNFDRVITPSGVVKTEESFSFNATNEQGTFVAYDKAGNKASKDFILSALSIGGGSTTFVGVDGIPSAWTNKSVTLRVGAQNGVDGVTGVKVGGGSQTVPLYNFIDTDVNVTTGSSLRVVTRDVQPVVIESTTVDSNCIINYTVETPLGSHTQEVVIDKIDKTEPTLVVVAEDNRVSVRVSDDLSGVKCLILPNGETIDLKGVSSSDYEFEFDVEGEVEVIAEDMAGNVTTKSVTMKFTQVEDEQPVTPDKPTDTPEIPNPDTPNPETPNPDTPNPETPNPDTPNPDNGDNHNPDNGDTNNPDNGGNGSTDDGTGKPDGDSDGNNGENNGDDSDDVVTPPSNNGSSNSTGGSSSNSNTTMQIKNDISKIKSELPFTLPIGKLNLKDMFEFIKTDLIIDVTKGVHEIKAEYQGVTFRVKVEGIEVEGINKRYEDVKENHWAYESIMRCTKLGLLEGLSADEYAPSISLNYADSLTALNRVLMKHAQIDMLQSRESVETQLKDYDKEHLAYYNMASILSKVSKDDGDTMLKVSKNILNTGITRIELADLLYNLLKDKGAAENKRAIVYSDMQTVPKGVQFCGNTGLMVGNKLGKFEPNKGLTRAELANVLIRLDNL